MDRPMVRRRRSTLKKRGDHIQAVLTRCRIDANADHARYDDSNGFVVHAEGGAAGHVRYVFKNLEQAYDVATKSFSLRRHKRFD